MELVLLWMAFGVVCALVAKQKGRSAFGWLLLGAVFGVFALIVLAFMPRLEVGPPSADGPLPEGAELHVDSGGRTYYLFDGKRYDRRADVPRPVLATDEKTCPECAETVRAAAKVCRYCGHSFEAGAVTA